jgi:hypothetical protein
VVTLRDALDEDGYVLLPGVFSAAEVVSIRDAVCPALARSGDDAEALRSHAGGVCGARNVLTLWPPAADVWREPGLFRVLEDFLGPRFGLVRVLYFDKPPGQSWSLPWHKDLTVAVRDNQLPSTRFRKPTRKAGVPHVEAPVDVLETMLTARLHLDDVTEENGPLRVVPGSHRHGKEMTESGTPRHVLATAGDVLLIRPLVAHSSGRCSPETQRHRRILHFEFAASPVLPDGYVWHTFNPSESGSYSTS